MVLGHAIESLDRFYDQLTDKEPVAALVKAEKRSRRNTTRKKAETFERPHHL
jgi:hypothetical protein